MAHLGLELVCCLLLHPGHAIKMPAQSGGRELCGVHRGQYYPQPYTTPPPNEAQIRLHEGLSAASVDLIVSGGVRVGNCRK